MEREREKERRDRQSERRFSSLFQEVDEPPPPLPLGAPSSEKPNSEKNTMEREKKKWEIETHHAGSPRRLVGVLPVKGTSVVGQDT